MRPILASATIAEFGRTKCIPLTCRTRQIGAVHTFMRWIQDSEPALLKLQRQFSFSCFDELVAKESFRFRVAIKPIPFAFKCQNPVAEIDGLARTTNVLRNCHGGTSHIFRAGFSTIGSA